MIDDLMNTIDELQIKLNDAEQEVENLKYKLQYITDCGIEKEHQYKEALRKCSPFLGNYCNDKICLFCKNYRPEHAADCEYVTLTQK